MANKTPMLADLLMASPSTGSQSGYSSEELEKAAAEASVGEIFGQLTKEAKEDLVGTMGWAGRAFGEQLAEAMAPVVVKLAEVQGTLLLLAEKLAMGAPNLQATQTQDNQKMQGSPKTWPIDSKLQALLKAKEQSNAQVSGQADINPPGENPQAYQGGSPAGGNIGGIGGSSQNIHTASVKTAESPLNPFRGAAVSPGDYYAALKAAKAGGPGAAAIAGGKLKALLGAAGAAAKTGLLGGSGELWMPGLGIAGAATAGALALARRRRFAAEAAAKAAKKMRLLKGLGLGAGVAGLGALAYKRMAGGEKRSALEETGGQFRQALLQSLTESQEGQA